MKSYSSREVINSNSALRSIGYDVIGMVKKTPKMFFRYNDEDMSLITILSRA